MANMIFTPYGGVGRVTGSNFMLEAEGMRFLLDCGLQQDGPDPDGDNHQAFPYEPASVDILFVTHAHMDHVGRIPKLVKDGFRGRIISTPETKALARLMLEDAAMVLADRYRRAQAVPLYRMKDVDTAFSLWEEHPYRQPLPLSHGFFVRFLDAGHILGSAMFEFTLNGEKFVHTGDLGNSPSPLLCDTDSIEDVRYLCMESVYGDRNHETRDERHGKLENAIRDVVKRKSVLIIPTFSLERTQVLLSELNELIEGNRVPLLPVFLDSPLAIRVTDVYRHMRANWNAVAKARIAAGDEPFLFPKLSYTGDREASDHIRTIAGPKIVIAGSGMSSGGRILKHERLYLPDPKNILLLVGYQSPGTMGREIAEGAKHITIEGGRVEVRAEIRQIEGYSSHKDLDHLVEFVEGSADTLQRVFVAMGEPKTSLFLVQRLRDYLNVSAEVPELGKSIELSMEPRANH